MCNKLATPSTGKAEHMQEVQTVRETGLKDKCKSLRERISMDAPRKVS